jgi:hypothetical protein
MAAGIDSGADTVWAGGSGIARHRLDGGAAATRWRRVTAAAGAAAAVTTLGFAVIAGSPVAAAPAVPASDPTSAWSCADESLRWGGSQVLDAAIPSFDTGVDVVAVAGTEVTVVGVSADGLDETDHARALPVVVGDVEARAGQALPAGDVLVVTDGSEVLRVHGVTVVIRRCLELASAPAAEPAPAGAGAAATGSAAASGAVSGSPVLPVTGGTSWGQTMIGAALVACGAALVSFGRRPRRPDTA